MNNNIFIPNNDENKENHGDKSILVSRIDPDQLKEIDKHTADFKLLFNQYKIDKILGKNKN